MLQAMIVNPSLYMLSGFSSSDVAFWFRSVLIEGGYITKNPGNAGCFLTVVAAAIFQPSATRDVSFPIQLAPEPSSGSLETPASSLQARKF
jgi:hypothetical protein